MFNTWKQSSNSYAILPTGPPFERPRNGKPRRSACYACRARKIRCTSELNGCQNCQARKLNCQYATEDGTFVMGAVKGKRQSRQKSGAIITSNHEANPENDVASRRPSDISEFLSDDLDRLLETDCSDSGVTLESATDVSSGSQSVLGNTQDFTPHTDISLPTIPVGAFHPDGQSGETSGVQSPLDFSTDAFHPFLNLSDLITSAETELTEADMSQDMIDNTSPSSCCLCPTTPLDTWQTLMVDISSKEATTDDFVRCQKAALASCETLVRCHTCCSQPQDVMLLIDTCAKLFESLKAQHSSEHATIAEEDDDDDRTQVLNNLRMARIQRLGWLTASIGDLLGGGGEEWLAHKGLLQRLQVQFTGLMFGW